mgnify:FL=1
MGVLFTDFKSAFDKVQHHRIYYHLKDAGFPEESYINYFKALNKVSEVNGKLRSVGVP